MPYQPSRFGSAWDDEDDEPYGEDDEDDDLTAPCPYCGRATFEDSPRCAHCGQYLSREDAPPGRKPWWLVLGVVACLYAVYRWTVLG